MAENSQQVVESGSSFDSVLTAGQEVSLQSSENRSVIENQRREASIRDPPNRAASISSTSSPPVIVSLGGHGGAAGGAGSADMEEELCSSYDADDTGHASSNNNNDSVEQELLQYRHNDSDNDNDNAAGTDATAPDSDASSVHDDTAALPPPGEMKVSRSGGTTRTRLETLDSDSINCAYDTSSNRSSPRRQLVMATPKKERPSLVNSNTPPPPPPPPLELDPDASPLKQCANSLRLQWISVTKQIRSLMLRPVVHLAVTSATYPRFTLIGITLLSFGLVYAGYSTNFSVRLDNEKLFTPANSEILEYEAWGNDKEMYFGTPQDVYHPEGRRQRRMTRGATFNIIGGKSNGNDNAIDDKNDNSTIANNMTVTIVPDESAIFEEIVVPTETAIPVETPEETSVPTTSVPVEMIEPEVFAVPEEIPIPAETAVPTEIVVPEGIAKSEFFANVFHDGQEGGYLVFKPKELVYYGPGYYDGEGDEGDPDILEIKMPWESLKNNTDGEGEKWFKVTSGDSSYSFRTNTKNDLRRINKMISNRIARAAAQAAATAEERRKHVGGGRVYSLIMHGNKENIFTLEGLQHAFDVVDQIRSTPDYEDNCRGGRTSFIDNDGVDTCEIRFITRFWNHNRTQFEEEIKTEEDLFNAADAVFYPDGGLVDLPFVLAEGEEDQFGRPNYGEAFFCFFFMKHNQGYFETILTETMLDLRGDWLEEKGNIYRIDFAGISAFETEAKKSIIGDLPLLPATFLIMCCFTCLVFFKWHRVQSRSLLGIGAVVTILLSILSGYGVMFICGVPMTLMTNLLVFVVFGIGLDDTFIITGAYFRTGHHGDPVQRIEKTMEAVGPSIILTTITTTVAFVLGSLSTVLPIRWLCLYAFPTIIIDFIFQITFFVALLTLDERRIQQNRYDCCTCFSAGKIDEESDDERTVAESPMKSPGIKAAGSEEDDDDIPMRNELVRSPVERQRATSSYSEPMSEHVADRFMRAFADKLMHPVVKVFVLLFFGAFAGLCVYSTTKMKQEFQFKDLLPKDSYAADFVSSVQYYSDRAMFMSVNFRFVDHADPEMRLAMEQYIEDLVSDVDALNEMPPICWVREFRNFVAANETLGQLPFYDQFDYMMTIPAIASTFGGDFFLREDGTILSSKCTIFVTDLDMDDVQDQIKLMQQTRAVADKQPVNKGKKLNCFFVYDLLLHIFAFYEVAAEQLIITTVSSVFSVCLVAFILIPHWSAVPIIFPIMSVLYIEMLGVLQMFGYRINVITYIILVISIGLLVDFIMHILLRYYESECRTREEKVKDALGTMGSSILVGGMSTFLGVTPLILSSSEIFSTVCIAFLAMVALGVSHGLILLPVLLSYFGTEDVVQHRQRLSIVQLTQNFSHRILHTLSDMHIAPAKSEVITDIVEC